MPSDKTKNILKGFGEGANVALQDSLARGARPSGDYDISDGEVVDLTTQSGTGSANNPLSRQPIGAVVVSQNDDTPRMIAVQIGPSGEVNLKHSPPDGTFTVWVF